MRNPQLNADGELTHLLTLEGLPAEVIVRILDTAVPFASIAERDVKKVPLLRGRSVFNLFFENSTRTRTTFEIAAKRLSADVINLNIGVLVDQQGRDAARHGRQPRRDERRHVRRPAFAVGCAASHRRAPEPHGPRARARRERRRRPARASDAGAARPLHDPPLQAGLPQPDGRHRRRRPALARRALADPRPDHARHAGSARDRTEDAVAHRGAGAGRAGPPRHARRPRGTATSS